MSGGIRLHHYTGEPLSYDPSRTYSQDKPTTFGKPHGFWVSVQGEDDWHAWVTENMSTERLKHCSQVNLTEAANLLFVTSAAGIDEVTERFAVETEYERRWYWRDSKAKWPIAWAEVAGLYDGVIIAPYVWSRRMSHDWYYGWDCASGCIWNLSAIAAVQPVEVTA